MQLRSEKRISHITTGKEKQAEQQKEPKQQPDAWHPQNQKTHAKRENLRSWVVGGGAARI